MIIYLPNSPLRRDWTKTTQSNNIEVKKSEAVLLRSDICFVRTEIFQASKLKFVKSHRWSHEPTHIEQSMLLLVIMHWLQLGSMISGHKHVFKTIRQTENYWISPICDFVGRFVTKISVERRIKEKKKLLHTALVSVHASVMGFGELVIISMTGRCNNICMHWKYKEVLHSYGEGKW